ncbi:GtrA family protein [Salinisphaera sp. P385]|uniref:GtrA family protein n=1 Tax=Spectribacter acetivorans TaxID=3075603 RepID=A0ABU3BBE3_9GAMM|nr:GtrA family protein [Salinisphaera sp. P385]MDT0619796.1 GtrA family protein [Salinisphaera sp. P385]
MRPHSLTLSRFLGVGVVATLAHVSIAGIVHYASSGNPFVANISGFTGAAAITYLGNFYWTFGHEADHGSAIARFFGLAILSLLASTAIIAFAHERLGLPFVFSLILVGAIVPITNYLLSRYWVFQTIESTARPSDYIELAFIISVLGMSVWACGSTILNHDTSWYLIATNRWLDGARLYEDIIEVNPPLAFYLTAPAVWVANKVPVLRPEMSFSLFVGALGLVSLIWARELLRRSLPSGRAKTAMIGAAVVALFVVPVPVFGQREHLMVILVLPYVLLAAFQPPTSSSHRIAIGLFAALGLALKPYFLALPLLIALTRVFQTRRIGSAFTPEHFAIAVACLAYVLAIFWLHPEYPGIIVPMARAVYGDYRVPLHELLVEPAMLGMLLLASAYLATNITDYKAHSAAQTLLVVVLSGGVFYLLQAKGWFYQRMPIHAFLCLAGMWLLIQSRHYRRRPAIAHYAVLMLLASATLWPVVSGRYNSSATANFSSFLHQIKDERSFIFLTSQVSLTFPMANAQDATPTSRYSALWLIPGSINRLESEPLAESTRKRVSEILEFARQSTVEDFLAGDPKTVFIDVRENKPYFDRSLTFDYLSFFMKDQRFATQWRRYKLIFQSPHFEVWQRNKSSDKTTSRVISLANQSS